MSPKIKYTLRLALVAVWGMFKGWAGIWNFTGFILLCMLIFYPMNDVLWEFSRIASSHISVITFLLFFFGITGAISGYMMFKENLNPRDSEGRCKECGGYGKGGMICGAEAPYSCPMCNAEGDEGI